jgi:site-specific DNA-methyltransferase (adenine-specific)
MGAAMNEYLDSLMDPLKEIEKVTKGDNDDEVPESAPPISRPGYIWSLGNHKLIVGDSKESDVFKRLMDGEAADLVWTDPPYGVDYVGKTEEALKIDNDSMSIEELQQFLKLTLGNAADWTKTGGGWYVAAPSGPQFLAFANVLTDLGIWRQTLVWIKDVFVMGRSDYHYKHEAIFYGWKPGSAHHEPPDRKQDTVWEFDRPKASREHPTMKPIDLIIKSLIMSTDKGAVVLDCFGGSGSTLIACERAGRVARLIEKDPRYADVICRRYQQVTGTRPVLTSTGEIYDFEADFYEAQQEAMQETPEAEVPEGEERIVSEVGF